MIFALIPTMELTYTLSMELPLTGISGMGNRWALTCCLKISGPITSSKMQKLLGWELGIALNAMRISHDH